MSSGINSLFNFEFDLSDCTQEDKEHIKSCIIDETIKYVSFFGLNICFKKIRELEAYKDTHHLLIIKDSANTEIVNLIMSPLMVRNMKHHIRDQLTQLNIGV